MGIYAIENAVHIVAVAGNGNLTKIENFNEIASMHHYIFV